MAHNGDVFVLGTRPQDLNFAIFVSNVQDIANDQRRSQNRPEHLMSPVHFASGLIKAVDISAAIASKDKSLADA